MRVWLSIVPNCTASAGLTVPGMCVLPVLWPLGRGEDTLRIFFFLRSSSRCSFCLFCTSISSEMKLFFTCFQKQNSTEMVLRVILQCVFCFIDRAEYKSIVRNALCKSDDKALQNNVEIKMKLDLCEDCTTALSSNLNIITFVSGLKSLKICYFLLILKTEEISIQTAWLTGPLAFH